jgi:hypothetical protein
MCLHSCREAEKDTYEEVVANTTRSGGQADKHSAKRLDHLEARLYSLEALLKTKLPSGKGFEAILATPSEGAGIVAGSPRPSNMMVLTAVEY